LDSEKFLYFTDDGVGITANKSELIFDDFFISNKKAPLILVCHFQNGYT
jgi:hypothetical protein